jgi:hypothetical protein
MAKSEASQRYRATAAAASCFQWTTRIYSNMIVNAMSAKKETAVSATAAESAMTASPKVREISKYVSVCANTFYFHFRFSIFVFCPAFQFTLRRQKIEMI